VQGRRRFETANEFAGDVERYLHDEPVHACPPSATYRFRKFVRRNKGAVLAASAALFSLLLLVIGLAISNRIIAAERNEKAQALQEKDRALGAAETQRRRAKDNLLNARIAIRDILVKPLIPGERTGPWSRLPPDLRKQFADGAVKYFETLMHEGDEDPSLRLETAIGYSSVATLYHGTGASDKAEEFQRRSIAIIERLIVEYPQEPAYRRQMGWAQFMLASTLGRTGRRVEAEAAVQRAIEIYEALVSGALDYSTASGASELATVYQSRGRVLLDDGRLEEAEQACRRSMEMLEKYERAASRPLRDEPGDRRAGSYLLLAKIIERRGDLGGGVAHRQRAMELYRALAEQHPSDVFYRRKLMVTGTELAQNLALQGKLAEATNLRSWCVQSCPDDASAMNSLAWALVRWPMHQDDPATAVRLASRAVELEPSAPDFWNTLGGAHYRAGNWQEAVAAIEKSVERGKGGNAIDFFFLAMAEERLGHREKALRYYDKAVDSLTRQPTEEARAFAGEAAEALGLPPPAARPATSPTGTTTAPAAPDDE
jgi:tetratricopeptide (TPR) repeat protein